MEREKGALRVVTEDGREGMVIAHDPQTLRVQVRFEDGTEEWVNMDSTRELAQDLTLPRELGS